MYRFGFNGQEKDDEITGVTGSHLNFKYRMYDSRVARFFAVDPITAKFPMLTPYQFASNTPIWAIEYEGLEGFITTSYPEGAAARMDAVSTPEKRKTALKVWTAAAIVVGMEVAGYAAWPYAVAYGGAALIWLQAPSNQQALVEGGSFVLNVINPGPEDIAPAPGPGGELGNLFEAGFRNLSKSNAGKWVTESIAGWSQAAIRYQESVTGVKAGFTYELNGVKFDAVLDNVLIDAKSSYDNFVDASGNFHEWFTGKQGLIDQARRQITAAEGTPIQWHFKTQKSLDATQEAFTEAGIEGIELIHTPE